MAFLISLMQKNEEALLQDYNIWKKEMGDNIELYMAFTRLFNTDFYTKNDSM